jgi:hypothetical protein
MSEQTLRQKNNPSDLLRRVKEYYKIQYTIISSPERTNDDVDVKYCNSFLYKNFETKVKQVF